jgi:RNA polymerase sigma-70 factor, ECF subfamily
MLVRGAPVRRNTRDILTGHQSMSDTLATSNEPSGRSDRLIAAYGFVPNLFRAQSELPRAVEAEERLIDAVVIRENRLSRDQKEAILQGVASVRENDYCRALYERGLPVLSADDSVVVKFALKLAKHTPWFSRNDVEVLKKCGFDDAAILEAVATTALGQMLCTLAAGLHPDPDRSPSEGLTSAISGEFPPIPEHFDWVETQGPYLGSQSRAADNYQPYTFFREEYGFLPNLYRVQNVRPDLVDAEVQALARILLPEDFLSRIQKEYVLLALSAANLNTYYVAMRGQILSTLSGASLEETDQIVEDHHRSGIPPADKVLLDETRKLASLRAPSDSRFEAGQLRSHGFTEPQIVEAVVVSGLANFLNTLQAGVGAVPDFPPRRVFGPKDLYPFPGKSRPISDAIPPEDPDAALVARVQKGEIDVFEELVRRHSRRVFGILAGLVGNMDDVRDATQDVFLKAFEHIGTFQGRSKFSTWLTSIAINTGTELLRQRKPSEPLEEEEDDEGFRPRQIQSWAENPEQLLAASQMTELVREGVLRLPEKYRIVVLLRDINQLSTEDAAAALGLSIPALKARLLRGRLMLRESLAPYFIRTENRRPNVQLR